MNSTRNKVGKPRDALMVAMERLARVNCILVPRATFAETEQSVRAFAISLLRGGDFDEARVISVLNAIAEADERRVLFERRAETRSSS